MFVDQLDGRCEDRRSKNAYWAHGESNWVNGETGLQWVIGKEEREATEVSIAQSVVRAGLYCLTPQ